MIKFRGCERSVPASETFEEPPPKHCFMLKGAGYTQSYIKAAQERGGQNALNLSTGTLCKIRDDAQVVPLLLTADKMEGFCSA